MGTTGASGAAGTRLQSGSAEEVRARLVALGMEMNTMTSRFAEATGLHQTDVRALWMLAEAEAPRTAGELGARLGLSSAAATRTVDRLERWGYVERVRDAEDRRRVSLQLTNEAGTATDAFFGGLAMEVAEATGEFTDAELETVARFLSRIHKAMRDSEFNTG